MIKLSTESQELNHIESTIASYSNSVASISATEFINSPRGALIMGLYSTHNDNISTIYFIVDDESSSVQSSLASSMDPLHCASSDCSLKPVVGHYCSRRHFLQHFMVKLQSKYRYFLDKNRYTRSTINMTNDDNTKSNSSSNDIRDNNQHANCNTSHSDCCDCYVSEEHCEKNNTLNNKNLLRQTTNHLSANDQRAELAEKSTETTNHPDNRGGSPNGQMDPISSMDPMDPIGPVDKNVDAGYAWVILVTMFLINATTFGTVRVYGLIFEKLARTDHYTRTEASLPFAISGAIENMGGMLTCFLVYKTSWRLVVFLGTLLTTCGHFGAYFSHSVTIDVVTIGLMCGLGTSFISIPFFQINNAYFVKYRTTAFGASLAGAAMGIYYVSPICEYTLEHYSVHTCYLVLSMILFPNVLLSLLLRPKSLSQRALHHHHSIGDNKQQQQQQEQITDNTQNDERNEINDKYAEKLLSSSCLELPISSTKPVSYSIMSRVRTRSNCSITLLDPSMDTKSNITSNSSINNGQTSKRKRNNATAKYWLANLLNKKIYTIPDYTKPGRYIPIMQFDCHAGFTTDNLHTLMSISETVANNDGSKIDEITSNQCFCDIQSANCLHSSTTTTATNITNNKPCSRNILTNPYFHLIWSTQVLYCWLNFIIGVVIVDFGKDRGIKSHVADTLILYWATGQLIGRIILGMIIDLRLLSYKNYTIVCLFVISSLTYMIVAMESDDSNCYSIVLSTIILALSAFIALLYLLFNGLMVTYVDGSLISVSIGISSFIGSFLLLPRASVIGYFRDTLGNYDDMINMLSLASLTFTLMWIVLPHLIYLTNEYLLTSNNTLETINATATATNKNTITTKKEPLLHL